jgi:hypothetical protein
MTNRSIKQREIDRIEPRRVARLGLANSMLHLSRLPAFYGDETLNVVRNHAYQRAAKI